MSTPSSLFPQRPNRNHFLRSWTGPLTEKLLRRPSDYGLGQLPARLDHDAVAPSVCGFCSTGCSLQLHLKEGHAVNLTANHDYPVNLGMACPKGWEALSPLDAPDRGTTPLMRNASGELVPASWADALDAFCTRFRGIQETHGEDALAWLGTGQMPTEELAFLGALGKFGMGIRHGDGNTRQCMATAVTAYKESFGFDAPPYTYADFEESDVIILVGSNLCIAHPIMWQRILRNRRNPEIIVVDPRTTETAMAATRHFAIQPKSDLLFFYALAHQLVKDGTIDREFIVHSTHHFDDFAAFLDTYTPERAAAASGIPVERIIELARLIGSGKRVSFWWTMGVNQSYEGTRLAQSLINLALMTGNIGKPGTGANSITGQCNAMGSRLFSNTTGLIGGRDFTNPDHRADVSRILEIPEDRIPTENCLAYDQIMDGIASGRIKGLWVVATNTAHSWIEQNRATGLLDKLECLVVQDMYHSTETARAADIFLPAAGWGEKDGTFINSERRIGRIRKVRRAPGLALADFHIFQLVAERWGCGDLFSDWTDPQAVFQIMKTLSAGRPCDFTGIQDFAHLDATGGMQWPYPEDLKSQISNLKSSAERRLFADGTFHHPDGKARFIFDAPAPLPEPTDAEYPFTLLTGRGTSAQWHTQTRTGKSDVLRRLYPQNAYAEINESDAARLGISADERISLSSRRGSITVTAHLCQTVRPGQVFVPMHYAEANRLTHSAFDPHSRQPNYKACAIQISKQT
jgi:anaerobic selenocysteine-containing dehydrogenase